MKLDGRNNWQGSSLMPPTRGHDLKLVLAVGPRQRPDRMPPTRGHDLKRGHGVQPVDRDLMPPTRGHDLKRQHGLRHGRL